VSCTAGGKPIRSHLQRSPYALRPLPGPGADQSKTRFSFIVAYNAERTIRDVIQRIPTAFYGISKHETEILIIDDSSRDQTFERARDMAATKKFHYVIREQFDAVALVHGDGQYAPERLPELLCMK